MKGDENKQEKERKKKKKRKEKRSISMLPRKTVGSNSPKHDWDGFRSGFLLIT
jgi:hypothetical protein